MWNHVSYGIQIGEGILPEDIKTVNLWYRDTGDVTHQGIDGGKVDLLRLSIDDRVTGFYTSGEWAVPVTDPFSEKAVEKLLGRCK